MNCPCNRKKNPSTVNQLTVQIQELQQRLKTMVRRHTDQMIRTRTCKAWNERIETGVLVKSHKGRNVSVEMKVGEHCQWRATGQCQKEMLAVSATTILSVEN